MKLSVVIPVRDEAQSIGAVLQSLHATLEDAKVPHELLVVDDYSEDDTSRVVRRLSSSCPSIHLIPSVREPGFGLAVRQGLAATKGEAVAIVMGDGSDEPLDLVSYYAEICRGADCVFGSRFVEGGRINGYPRTKYLLNRLGNRLISTVYSFPYDDFTNAFKAYRRSLLDRLRPIRSTGFSLSLELCLKAISTGAQISVVPISWSGRSAGESKLHLLRDIPGYLRVVALERPRAR